MNEHWNNFLEGMGQVLVLWPDDDYLRPQQGEDALADYRNLRGDMGRIAKDLRKTLKKTKAWQNKRARACVNVVEN